MFDRLKKYFSKWRKDLTETQKAIEDRASWHQVPKGTYPTKPRKFLYNERYYSQRELRCYFSMSKEEILALPSKTHEELYLATRAKRAAIKLPQAPQGQKETHGK